MIKDIVLATGIFPPDIGGPAIYTKKLAEIFFQRGINVRVIAYGAAGGERNFKYKISYISRRWPAVVRQWIFFIKLCFFSRRADAVVAMDSLGAGLPAVLAGKLFQKKTLMRLGGDFLWEKFVESGLGEVTLKEFYLNKFNRTFPFLNFLVTASLKMAGTVLFTTEFQRRIFIEHYGLETSRTVVVGNVFEPKPFNEDFQIPDRTNKIILWAGRFLKLKNLNFLLRVIKKVDSDNFLVLMGDGPEKQNIEKAVHNLGLSSRVIIKESVDNLELRESIRNSYLCVLPSLSDISPNFALECLNQGRAIVMTSESGIGESLPGFCGLGPRDEDSWVKFIENLLNNSDFYISYLDSFLNGYREKTWSQLADDYLNILES